MLALPLCALFHAAALAAACANGTGVMSAVIGPSRPWHNLKERLQERALAEGAWVGPDNGLWVATCASEAWLAAVPLSLLR